MVNPSLKMMTHSDHRPSFFKIMYGDVHSDKLRIPPHFVKHISRDTAARATLRGPSGKLWKVKWDGSKDGIYLQGGWQKFHRAHSLGDSEFVIFKYYGNMCFSVQIFDKTGMEITI